VLIQLSARSKGEGEEKGREEWESEARWRALLNEMDVYDIHLRIYM
jgi:hypothetical protein